MIYFQQHYFIRDHDRSRLLITLGSGSRFRCFAVGVSIKPGRSSLRIFVCVVCQQVIRLSICGRFRSQPHRCVVSDIPQSPGLVLYTRALGLTFQFEFSAMSGPTGRGVLENWLIGQIDYSFGITFTPSNDLGSRQSSARFSITGVGQAFT